MAENGITLMIAETGMLIWKGLSNMEPNCSVVTSAYLAFISLNANCLKNERPFFLFNILVQDQ